MSYKIPTTQQLKESHESTLESALNQDSPSNEIAFIKVLSKTEAALDIGLYKFAADAAIQNLALTATNAGLDRIGNDNDTPRKQEEVAILTATLPATTGTVIPATTDFTGDSNGVRYRPEADVTAVASVATLSLRATDPGTQGNLDVGATLSIGEQIAGAETVATVTAQTQLGVDEETDADYRPRVLFAQRATTGGANATDHKIWSEAVTGVRRAFPYAGRPPAEGTSYPGDRTVYVESTTTIDADGIAPTSLLDDVRDAINTDPDTGKSRSVLGLTDDTLYVESITRTSIFVEISDLSVSAEKESELKSDMEDALNVYFRSIAAFVDGVDLPQERTDSITSTSVSQIVQDVLSSYGASAQTVSFGPVVGVPITLYFLDQGELTKLGSITYA
jgi:uncharacterized phage protein gp47/JayE